MSLYSVTSSATDVGARSERNLTILALDGRPRLHNAKERNGKIVAAQVTTNIWARQNGQRACRMHTTRAMRQPSSRTDTAVFLHVPRKKPSERPESEDIYHVDERHLSPEPRKFSVGLWSFVCRSNCGQRTMVISFFRTAAVLQKSCTCGGKLFSICAISETMRLGG